MLYSICKYTCVHVIVCVLSLVLNNVPVILIVRNVCVVSEEYYDLSPVLPDLYANTELIRFWRTVSKENVRGLVQFNVHVHVYIHV